MKRFAFVLLLSHGTLVLAQTAKPAPALKSALLQQLRTTHNQKGNWFVPVSVAVAGLTPEQAKWKDRSGNHSILELANHLIFWDQRSLAKLEGIQQPPFDGNNDETFQSPRSWDATVRKLDAVLTDWERRLKQRMRPN